MATPARSRFLRVLVIGLALVTSQVAAGDASALDLTGRWRVETSGVGPFGDIVQSDAAVSVTLQDSVSMTPILYEGTVTGDRLQASTLDDGSCPRFVPSVYLQIFDDHATLYGTETRSGCNYSPIAQKTIFLTRCECDDGNVENGDGCDAHCRVESCYSCSGSPSICVPTANGESCNDRNDCTANETCNDGICGDADLIPECVDMTGSWVSSKDSEFPDIFKWGASVSLLRQENHVIERRSAPDSVPFEVGSIDDATKTLQLTPPLGDCQYDLELEAKVDTLGNSYKGGGEIFLPGGMPFSCVYMNAEFGEHGYRCRANEPCPVPSCMACAGDPQACSPVPDNTPCQDSNPCTYVATCIAGACIPKETVACPTCTSCGPDGICQPGPRQRCLTATQTNQARLTIINVPDPGKQALRFFWTKGSAFASGDLKDPYLGDPFSVGQVSMCVFDGSTTAAAPLYQADVPANGDHSDTPRRGWWQDQGEMGIRYRDPGGEFCGINSLALRPGTDGKTSVKLRGDGPALLEATLPSPIAFPTPPFSLPLLVQVQMAHGLCVEATFDADGVGRNSDGVFRARGVR